jgi:hypothetical protein
MRRLRASEGDVLHNIAMCPINVKLSACQVMQCKLPQVGDVP